MERAQLKMIDTKQFAVVLGGHEFGRSKTHFDADFHINRINDALDAAYREGYQKAIKEVAEGK